MNVNLELTAQEVNIVLTSIVKHQEVLMALAQKIKAQGDAQLNPQPVQTTPDAN